jgi:hypothetical protein
MLGMDQGQRSNAVGFNTAYLPDGEGARHGGGTYTGQATEPTIQDYENFFGPSARDIKTDLQRFKRHGRWHLPDILQGPNPWLTDRVDGLITDATNSPFTTKILPYRYKEEADAKIKWNVWSFDEGVAARVPYESAARTLTQSKRSFAGYMVRQGMAIVLEHNFMMTPKGRENFKNQLNQLIGSIQYTNDLDVHMALILAPSYQQTMRERYYTSDKSPPQICREFADLFGMMQKNVNALDILIEEGKAILRTWGGPMPDFLLCNSKLTFQMTMTPEKTNYITQGIDGVKRLRQGPDLGSYRGLSVVHSRSFAMETGQHPRDVLRRRVRTAEYYRIPPNKSNVQREFEFYNEERDTWFTLTFQDLLKYAKYHARPDADGTQNAADIDTIYHGLSASAGDDKTGTGGAGAFMLGSLETSLGARYNVPANAVPGTRRVMTGVGDCLSMTTSILQQKWSISSAHIYGIADSEGPNWYIRGLTDNLGFQINPPRDNELWETFQDELRSHPDPLMKTALSVGPLSPAMTKGIFGTLRLKPLNDPFAPGNIANPGTVEWFSAFQFYLDVFRRGGISLAYLDYTAAPGAAFALANVVLKTDRNASDVRRQILNQFGASGCVNHSECMWLIRDESVPARLGRYLNQAGLGKLVGRCTLMTVEVLDILLAKYQYNGVQAIGLDVIEKDLEKMEAADVDDMYVKLLEAMFASAPGGQYFANPTLMASHEIQLLLAEKLSRYFGDSQVYQRVDPDFKNGELLAEMGVSTIPMYLTSLSHLYNTTEGRTLRALSVDGHLSIGFLKKLHDDSEAFLAAGVNHPWISSADVFLILDPNARYARFLAATPAERRGELRQFFRVIRDRIFNEPFGQLPGRSTNLVSDYGNLEVRLIQAYFQARANNTLGPVAGPRVVPSGSSNVVINLQDFFDSPPVLRRESPRQEDLRRAEDVEIVIVRPNIEHNMLGVIMGLGGEQLGHTLWGQTELSVYDDSMHGLWGMSYKYHERAIVFNEKNLIRMWDIAYDGYNGGKDDTNVDWTAEDETAPNGPEAFKRATLDLSKNYRGPSMMVMAFAHNRRRQHVDGGSVFDREFRRNWPSPIVFYDSYDGPRGQQTREALPIDYDNVQTVDVEEFRVFNNDLYYGAYKDYRQMMPEFKTMHLTRKTAGQSSADAETGTDCLAFQGTMRIKERGMVVQEILGSGHHGPDYVGIASVRAGKGQKVAGQAPAPYRLV